MHIKSFNLWCRMYEKLTVSWRVEKIVAFRRNSFWLRATPQSACIELVESNYTAHITLMLS